MSRETIWFRTQWFGYRKTDVRNCIEHLYALKAAEQRLAAEKRREWEGAMAQLAEENSMLRRQLASQGAAQAVAAAGAEDAQAQLDVLNRKLAAAQAEIRRCQTRMFAYEREVLALRRENAELEAACRRARTEVALPAAPLRLPVPERTELPRRSVAERVQAPSCTAKPVPPAPKQPPAPKTLVSPPQQPAALRPQTKLEQLSALLLEQMDRMMREA